MASIIKIESVINRHTNEIITLIHFDDTNPDRQIYQYNDKVTSDVLKSNEAIAAFCKSGIAVAFDAYSLGIDCDCEPFQSCKECSPG